MNRIEKVRDIWKDDTYENRNKETYATVNR